MVEAAAEATEELMNKYLEEGDLSEEEIIAGLRQRTIATEIQPHAVRHGRSRTRACSACWTPCWICCLRRPTSRTWHGHRRRRKTCHPQGGRQREVLCAGVQADDRPVCRAADVRARLLRRADQGRHVYNSIKGKKERIGRIVQMHANDRARKSKKFALATSLLAWA
jgi:elongation factor G